MCEIYTGTPFESIIVIGYVRTTLLYVGKARRYLYGWSSNYVGITFGPSNVGAGKKQFSIVIYIID